MTQPGALDVAYVEIRPDTKNFSGDLNTDVETAYKKLESTTDKTTSNIANKFSSLSDNVKQHLQSVTTYLREQGTRLVSDSDDSTKKIGDAATKAAFTFSDLFDKIGTKLVSVGKSILGSLIPAFLSLNSVAALAAIAINLVVVANAALAASPGIVLGLAGAFGILFAATRGIGKAFTEINDGQKKVAAGGVALAQQQRQEANAVRDLKQAQLDLNAARQQAIRDIERLNVDLTNSRANQLRSADDLRKAEILLEQTRKVGTADQINEATIAYQEAKAAAEADAQTTRELEQDKKKADLNGVEGSDRVRAAIERVKDAQDSLAQAQERVGAGAAVAATAFSKLTASAQEFVLSLVKAKNELKPLQQQIQETFFSGTGDLIKPITTSIKGLEPEILSLTKTFNNAFKGLLKFLASPELESAGKGALKGFQDILISISPSVLRLLKAFAGLAAQFGKTGKDGKSTGTILGESIGKVLDRISKIIEHVDLQKVFTDAKKAIAEIKPILLTAYDLFKNLISLIKTISPIVLGLFRGMLIGINKVVVFIDDVVSGIQDFGDKINQFSLYLEKNFRAAVENVKKFFRDLKTVIGDTINGIGDKLNELIDKIFGLRNRLFGAGKSLAKSLFDGLADSADFVKNFANKITNGLIRGINTNIIGALNKGIDKIQNGFNKIPGISLDLLKFPKIPELEKGGLVTSDTILRAGEKGKAEGVIPLEDPRALAAIGRAIAKASPGQNDNAGIVFGPGSVVVNFTGAVPSEIEAMRTGNAVGSGIIAALARQSTRLSVRTMGTHG